jgi:4-amino-4-deoxy-L-arabinose transferase-like glycosyltransferase
MLATGDFFHPAINKAPYFDKPLLSYWLIAIVSAVTGRLDEWVIRLPSAISGLLALWGTIFLGKRLWSEQVGRTAGWILLTTFGMLFWARTGTADMENLAAITLAVVWYCSRKGGPTFFTFFVFYIICFTGAQTKGLVAVAVPVLAVLADLLRQRSFLSLFKPPHLMALAINLAIYLTPFIYAAMTREGYQANGLALVFQENILRYFQPFDHVEPFYVYLYHLPALFLPWAPLLIIALFKFFTAPKNLDRRTRWLMDFVVLVFVFFTVSGSRRSYYILPMLPFCAILTSVFLNSDGNERWKRLGLGLQSGSFILIAVLLIFVPLVRPLIEKGMALAVPDCFGYGMAILGVLALIPTFLYRLRLDLIGGIGGAAPKTTAIILTSAILMGVFFWQQLNMDVYRTERPFAMGLKSMVTGISSGRIAFYHEVSPNILFYLDLEGPVQVVNNPESLKKFLAEGSHTKILVSDQRHTSDVACLLSTVEDVDQPELREKTYPWERKTSKKFVAWKIERQSES